MPQLTLTLGGKTYRGIALNEDFPSPPFPYSSSSSFTATNSQEAEKHVKACQNVIFEDIAMRNKLSGVDVSMNFPGSSHTTANGSTSSANNHATSTTNSNTLHLAHAIHSHLDDLNAQLSTHLNNHLHTLHTQLHTHLHNNVSNGNGGPNGHPLSFESTDSNSSTDTEVENHTLSEMHSKPNGHIYDDFADDDFLSAKTGVDFLGVKTTDHTIDGLDLMSDIAPDLNAQQITKHTQDDPIGKSHFMVERSGFHQMLRPDLMSPHDLHP